MIKKNYQSPIISMEYVDVEETIATGSNFNTIEVTTEGGDVRFSEYETIEESNKDFNINF